MCVWYGDVSKQCKSDLQCKWPKTGRRVHKTHEGTHQALRARQPRFALPYHIPGPTFLAYSRLPYSTHHPAPPTCRRNQSTTRQPAGSPSPTKPTLTRASIDATRQFNAPGSGPGSVLAVPRPTTRCRPTPWLPNPRSVVARRAALAVAVALQVVSSRRTGVARDSTKSDPRAVRI